MAGGGPLRVAVGHSLAALGLLATVIAAFWTARQLDLLLAFWLLIPAALLYGFARAYGRRLVRFVASIIKRVRDYEKISQSAAKAIAERDDLQKRLEASTSDLENLLGAAIVQGRKRAVGELRAVSFAGSLTPVACVVEQGELFMVAHGDDVLLPTLGSRLFLRVVEMSSVKAALVVVAVSLERQNVKLVVDQVMDVHFMDAIKRRAYGATDPPPGVVISARSLSDPSDLERGVED